MLEAILFAAAIALLPFTLGLPMQRTTLSAGGLNYATTGLFPSGYQTVEQITVDLSTMTYSSGNGEVDAEGYLKPGVPLKSDGTLADGTTDEYIYGVTIEPVYVGSDPIDADADLDGLADIQVAVARSGLVNRDVAEDNLGRAYTANEIAAFAAAGSNLMLTTT